MSKQILIKPQAGQTEQCVVQHGHVYALGFDPSNVVFSRTEGDLLMSFDDGASIVLRDFYNESQIGDFFLELADGNVLSARSVIESLEFILDDFVTGSQPVYTAQAHQPGHEASGSSHTLFGEEDEALTTQAMFEARTLSELAAEDSFAADSGAFLPVAGHGAESGVYDPHASSAIARNDYLMQEQSPVEEYLDPGREGGSLFGEGVFSHEDEPAFFAAQPSGESGASEIITPRVHSEGEINPFLANTATVDGAGDSGNAVLFANNAREADLLLLEDLLDTSMPEDLPSGAERVPAFEELFASGQDEVFPGKIEPFAYAEVEHLNTVSASDPAAEGSEQLLLAFLRMGSF